MRTLLQKFSGTGMAIVLAASAAPASADPLPPADVSRLASVIAFQLREHFPPAASTLILVSIGKDGVRTGLTPALEKAVRGAGFAVTANASGRADPVRYGVTPAFGGYVVQLEYGGEARTQFFRRDASGALAPAGPTSVRAMQ